MMIFVTYEDFFELHPPEADGTKKRRIWGKKSIFLAN